MCLGIVTPQEGSITFLKNLKTLLPLMQVSQWAATGFQTCSVIKSGPVGPKFRFKAEQRNFLPAADKSTTRVQFRMYVGHCAKVKHQHEATFLKL